MTSASLAIGTLDTAQVQQVLATAEKAPAVHRIRPWRFHYTATAIELLLDLPAGDWGQEDDKREAWVASGAALLNLRLAIRSCGVEPVVHLMPDLDHPSILAEVEIDGHRPTTKDGQELSLAITLLDTDNDHLQNTVLSDALVVELRSAARAEQAWIALLPASAFPSPPEPEGTPRPPRLPDPAACLLIVGTLQDDPISRLRAGQAMQRVLLTLTRSDLSARFIAMSADTATSRTQLRNLIGGGLWPQVLLQVGETPA